MASEKHISKHAKKEEPKPFAAFFKFLLKMITNIILIVILLTGAGLAYLSFTEYKPEEKMDIAVTGESSNVLKTGKKIKIMTWNIGYGALGDNADFFMDGGKSVNTADEARVNSNLSGIISEIKSTDPDILFIQETDIDSSRSHHINEYSMLQDEMSGYTSSFANNFKAFVPYPIPPMGKVDSGVATFSAFKTGQAQRIQLPIPFGWPLRVVNLKRCILKTSIPLKGSDKELVLIDLHLEAYDNGEGKEAQTAMLADLMNEEASKGNYVIAGGDFNQIFSSEGKDLYPVAEGLWEPGVIETGSFEGGWQFLMDKKVPSCRSLDRPYADANHDDFQYYLIDGFIVSDNIEVKSCKNKDLSFECSDHNPVVIEVVLK